MARPLVRRQVATLGILTLTLALVAAVNTARVRYNSEEHRLIVDLGVAGVQIPPGVKLSMTNIAPTAYAAAIDSAKQLGSAQDRCYSGAQFYQSHYNEKIYVPPPDRAPNKVLVVPAYADPNNPFPFTLGELASLYGDYRKTTYCAGGKCYLTDADVGNVNFGRGTTSSCPRQMPVALYLRAIARGLVPPVGPFGDLTKYTAASTDQYSEAGWWGDEMMRIANVNDWHFGNAAVHWYTGMHRLALLYADSARTDSTHWTRALHYEANALHSLTDLFAFGHIVTSRDRTSYGIMKAASLVENSGYEWMTNVLRMGGARRDADGVVSAAQALPAIRDIGVARNDHVESFALSWMNWANFERIYHDWFNGSGARVRNMNGDTFSILGDGGLAATFTQGARDAIANAVKTSVQSLVDAHVQLQRGGSVATIGQLGSSYFAALKYIPVYVVSEGGNYFTGMWTPYAPTVSWITGVNKSMPAGCVLKPVNGKQAADWYSVPMFPKYPDKRTSSCATF